MRFYDDDSVGYYCVYDYDDGDDYGVDDRHGDVEDDADEDDDDDEHGHYDDDGHRRSHSDQFSLLCHC